MAISIEQHARRVVDGNAHMLVPWVLMASFAYYHLDTPLVSDALFDEWCLRLHRVWWRVKHDHKELITRGETTCRVMIDRYPERVAGATTYLLEKWGLHNERRSSHPRLATKPDAKKAARRARRQRRKTLRSAG